MAHASPGGPRVGAALRHFAQAASWGLNYEAAKERRSALGAELRTRVPGQRAATIEARNGTLRTAAHLAGEDLKGANAPRNFKRLLADSIFACNAFL